MQLAQNNSIHYCHIRMNSTLIRYVNVLKQIAGNFKLVSVN